MKALLLSGGIESTCIAYWKRPDLCVTIDYGQVCAETEIQTSVAICKHLGLKHLSLKATAGRRFGLLGEAEPLQTDKPEFWPFRNQFLGTVTAMTLYGLNVREIWFGTVHSDTKFLDGSQSFFKTFNDLVFNQEGRIRIKAPALRLSTERLITISGTPRSILGATFSCHRAALPCGDCPGCWKQTRLLYSKPIGRLRIRNNRRNGVNELVGLEQRQRAADTA